MDMLEIGHTEKEKGDKELFRFWFCSINSFWIYLCVSIMLNKFFSSFFFFKK